MPNVLVVGGGPVGLMTALGLARENVTVTVIEAEKDVVYSPRAISYAWPILAGLEVYGVLDDMMRVGHTLDERSWRIFKTGETITYNHDAVRDITDRPYSLTLGQDLLAKVVLQHLMRYPHVTIHWGTTFTGLDQNSDQVAVSAERDGRPVKYHADWVVGADGGRSAVRKSIGLTMDGFTWPQRFVVTNIYFDFEKHGWNSGYLVDPVYGAVIYKINLDGLWRFTFAENNTLPLGSVLDRIRGFIAHVLPGDKTYEMVLHTAYNCISGQRRLTASAGSYLQAMQRISQIQPAASVSWEESTMCSHWSTRWLPYRVATPMSAFSIVIRKNGERSTIR